MKRQTIPPWASWLWPLLIALALLTPFLAPCFGPVPSADQPAPTATVPSLPPGTLLPTMPATITAVVIVSTPVPLWTAAPTATATTVPEPSATPLVEATTVPVFAPPTLEPGRHVVAPAQIPRRTP